MQRGGITWKRHWQHEDGAGEKVRGMAALELWVGGGGGGGRRASMRSGKPWIGGDEKESIFAVPTLFE
jgi:hypothetical protein